ALASATSRSRYLKKSRRPFTSTGLAARACAIFGPDDLLRGFVAAADGIVVLPPTRAVSIIHLTESRSISMDVSPLAKHNAVCSRGCAEFGSRFLESSDHPCGPGRLGPGGIADSCIRLPLWCWTGERSRRNCRCHYLGSNSHCLRNGSVCGICACQPR